MKLSSFSLVKRQILDFTKCLSFVCSCVSIVIFPRSNEKSLFFTFFFGTDYPDHYYLKYFKEKRRERFLFQSFGR